MWGPKKKHQYASNYKKKLSNFRDLNNFLSTFGDIVEQPFNICRAESD